MQVIDTLGNTNYTFKINFDDNDDTTFYNLVINQNSESNTNISYILKYKIDQDRLQQWVNNDYDFRFFVGKLYRYNVNDFISNFSFNKTSSKNLPVDICPCNIEPIDGSSGSGGGGGSSGGGIGGGSSGTFTVCRNEVVTFENPCNDINPDNVWTSPHVATSTCSGSPGPTNIIVRICETISNKSFNKTTKDDCQNPCDDDPNNSDGEIGIILTKPNPCDDIKKQIENQAYQDIIDDLADNYSLQHETGYSQNSDGSFDELTNNTNNGHSLIIPVVTTTKGYVHAHLNSYEDGTFYKDGTPKVKIPKKIFSPRDILTFLEIILNAEQNNIPISDVYGTMTSSTKDYTLRFTGNINNIHSKIINLRTKIKNKKYADNVYLPYFKNFRRQEAAFLNWLKDEVGVNGINLYKIRGNGDIETKALKPTNNKKVVTEDCFE